MKNIEKKWTLFMIATFATFFGIVDTLLDKSTSAMEDEIAYNELVDIVFNDNVLVDEENKIISNVMVGSRALDVIATSGVMSLYENDGNQIDSINVLKTGDVIKVVFEDNISYEYKVSVLGDVTGDGISNKDDMFLISEHLIKDSLITGEEFILAGDTTSDGKISLVDVVKLVREFINGNE